MFTTSLCFFVHMRNIDSTSIRKSYVLVGYEVEELRVSRYRVLCRYIHRMSCIGQHRDTFSFSFLSLYAFPPKGALGYEVSQGHYYSRVDAIRWHSTLNPGQKELYQTDMHNFSYLIFRPGLTQKYPVTTNDIVGIGLLNYSFEGISNSPYLLRSTADLVIVIKLEKDVCEASHGQAAIQLMAANNSSC